MRSNGIRFEGTGLNHLHGARKKTYGTVGMHPYMRAIFWNNPCNHFWKTGMYSEASQDYFNDWLSELNKDHI